MKVVINSCYGGFGLSAQAIRRYAELSGFKVYPYKSDDKDYDKTVRCNDESGIWSYWLKEDVGDFPSKKKLNNAEWFSYRDLKRDDKILIQVVEELGEKANGDYAKLKIVEIPDGVNWEISEYDGNEHIAELHQTWG